MRPETLVCWHCGEPLARMSLPLGRLDECPECRAQLHVCRMCRHYDSRYVGGCRHDHADKVQDKERANFCQFFRPRRNAFGTSREAAAPSRSHLEELFGEPSQTGPVAGREARERSRSVLGGLFGGESEDSGDEQSAQDESHAARKRLDSLFDNND